MRIATGVAASRLRSRYTSTSTASGCSSVSDQRRQGMLRLAQVGQHVVAAQPGQAQVQVQVQVQDQARRMRMA